MRDFAATVARRVAVQNVPLARRLAAGSNLRFLQQRAERNHHNSGTNPEYPRIHEMDSRPFIIEMQAHTKTCRIHSCFITGLIQK